MVDPQRKKRNRIFYLLSILLSTTNPDPNSSALAATIITNICFGSSLLSLVKITGQDNNQNKYIIFFTYLKYSYKKIALIMHSIRINNILQMDYIKDRLIRPFGISENVQNICFDKSIIRRICGKINEFSSVE